LLAHAVTLAVSWRRIDRRTWAGWALASGAALVALLPLVWVSTRQSAQVAWLNPPDGQRIERLLRTFTGPTELVLCASLLLACAALNAPLGRQGKLSLNAVALPLVLVPPAALFVVSQRTPLYHDRYVFFALAGASLLVAAGGERAARAVRRLGGPGPVRRRAVGALAGVAAVGAAFVWQFPVHQEERTGMHRPDDLAAVARMAARELNPGDPLLFLPSIGRRTAMTYPQGFEGTRDLALRTPGPESGTLYGKETDAAELRRRLAGVERVWVLAEPFAVRAAWYPKSATERAKLSVVNEQFVLRDEFVSRSGVLRQYVRRPPGKPMGWPADADHPTGQDDN
ncbi:hypothetical protein P8605_39555, partial [Streptomyces sp. T-3]|nr:hypothetical protein [Streptomyces sp. T-3]